MLSSLVLGLSLALIQTDDETPTATAEPVAEPANPTPDRWLVMTTLQGTWEGWLLDGNRLAVSGWTDVSGTASSVAPSNLPMGFNYRGNDFLLQQNWLRVDRTVVTSGTTEPTFGFRSDTILPGSDYRFTLARGLFSNQLTADNGQPNLYGIDPVQFYGVAYFPTIGRGLDIKLGRFFGQYGEEDIDAPSNALLSHSYTFLDDPFTNTGLLATLKLTDDWSVQSGVVLGSDVFIDRTDKATYIGSIKWAPPDAFNSLQFSVIVGPGRYDQVHNVNNPEIFDLVYTHEINKRLSSTIEGLFGFETNVPGIGTADWFGVVNYLTYEFTPRLSGTTRLEFFDDPQGQRTGYAGLYSTLTTGVSLRPCKSIIIRPEVRYDYNDESRPFENNHGLFTLATDVILRW
jgi:hypothetical protein